MVSTFRLFVVLTLLMFAIIACDTDNGIDDDSVQSQTVDSEPQGRIVFQSNRDNSLSIYIMDADGDDVKRLTQGRDSNPNLSSDSRIVYDSASGDQNDIFVTTDTGNETPRNLTRTDEAWEYLPVWSPDNSLIAYVSDLGGDEEIWVMDADGDNQTQLTDNDIFDTHPAWSPSGEQILFQSNRDGDNELYSMTVDGDEVVQLTDNEDEDIAPMYSPDKSSVAFVSDRDGNNEIYIMNPDGTLPTRLTQNEVDDAHPAWSLDGKWLVYQSVEGSNVDIYLMRADGSNTTRLTDERGVDSDPSWGE